MGNKELANLVGAFGNVLKDISKSIKVDDDYQVLSVVLYDDDDYEDWCDECEDDYFDCDNCEYEGCFDDECDDNDYDDDYNNDYYDGYCEDDSYYEDDIEDEFYYNNEEDENELYCGIIKALTK